MFKKGDYIVLLGLYNKKTKNFEKDFSVNFLTNNIYKQRKEYYCISPEVDSGGSRMNGWAMYSFSDNDKDNKKIGMWRYAKPIEIIEYEKRGKPFDVKELATISIIEDLNQLIDKYESRI